MSEHSTPDTPSTPTSDEAAALALLDARGRQAATDLRASVGRLLAPAEVPPPASGGDRSDRSEGSDETSILAGTDGADIAVVGLRPATPGHGRRNGRTWLLAAAILVVVGLVAGLTLLLRAGDEDAVAGDAPGYLVPGSLPGGWALQEAREMRTTDTPGALTGTVTVYGDPTADDPWTGPKLSVWHASDDGQGLDEGDGVEQITVGGLPATIEESDGGLLVRVIDGNDMVLVMADQLERPVVLASAEAAVTGDAAGVRPDGFEELASGPLSAAGTFGGFAVDGLSLVYGGSSSATGQIVVVQRAGDRDDAGLLRLMPVDVETTEVRGQPAYVAGEFLQWYEPAAQVVITVTGSDIDRSLLEQFAAGLRPTRPGEIDELVQAYGGSGPFGQLQPGEVLVADGELPDGQPWQLVASDDGSGGFGLSFADGAGSTGIGVAKDSGWGTLSVDVADHQLTGGSTWVGVFGAVTPEASEVVVEAPGHEPIHLPLHTVDGIAGWDEKAFAGVVPVDLASAQVVARSADGTELARTSLDAGSDGVPPGDAGEDSATSETCQTLPDGGEECSAGGSAEMVPAPGG